MVVGLSHRPSQNGRGGSDNLLKEQSTASGSNCQDGVPLDEK